MLKNQIDDIAGAIEEAKRQRGERFTIKQMERTRKGLEARIKKLNDQSRKDDVVTFEQLGVDRLFVTRAMRSKPVSIHKDGQRGRHPADGRAKELGYVPQMPVHG